MHDDDRHAMNIDPEPPGVTIRAFTAAEIMALDAPLEPLDIKES